MKLNKKIAEIIDLNSNVEKDIIKASRYYHKKSKFWKLMAFIKHRKNRKKYNIEIYPECQLGNINIPHAVGIVVGRTAEIGDNTTIMPDVVIGAKYSAYQENPKNRGGTKTCNYGKRLYVRNRM